MIRDYVAQFDSAGRAYAAQPASRTAVLGHFTLPWAENAILLRADTLTHVERSSPLGFDETMIEGRTNGTPFAAALVEVSPQAADSAARAYRSAGYAVYSIEYYPGMPINERTRASYRLSAY
jgi:hypothetical protein